MAGPVTDGCWRFTEGSRCLTYAGWPLWVTHSGCAGALPKSERTGGAGYVNLVSLLCIAAGARLSPALCPCLPSEKRPLWWWWRGRGGRAWGPGSLRGGPEGPKLIFVP